MTANKALPHIAAKAKTQGSTGGYVRQCNRSLQAKKENIQTNYTFRFQQILYQ
jgi:hypothetical protein